MITEDLYMNHFDLLQPDENDHYRIQVFINSLLLLSCLIGILHERVRNSFLLSVTFRPSVDISNDKGMLTLTTTLSTPWGKIRQVVFQNKQKETLVQRLVLILRAAIYIPSLRRNAWNWKRVCKSGCRSRYDHRSRKIWKRGRQWEDAWFSFLKHCYNRSETRFDNDNAET